MQSKVSIIIPSFETPEAHLKRLYDSLINQSYKNYEVIIVDDGSHYHFYDLICDERFKVIYKKDNSGAAECRNIGVNAATSEYIFFTDSDCELDMDTLSVIMSNIAREDLLVGNTITKAKSRFGKTVGYLGFPGGGVIGFQNVWKVDSMGYTNTLSSCNLAIKKKAFYDIGQFDATFPVPGGEDTVFARAAINKKYRIKYVPSQIVFHVEKKNFKSFIKWQITRGQGNYHIKKKLGNVRGFLTLRLWSFKNSIMKSGWTYLPAVTFLIILSVYYQTKGYWMEKNSQEKNCFISRSPF